MAGELDRQRVLALVVAVVGWIGVAAWLSSAASPASGEWRTEQFRDITFRVPVIRGGFDDGTTVRALTRENCRAVLPQPLGFRSGHLSVHDLCAA